MSQAQPVLSFGEFLDTESRSIRRHELVGGCVYAMAGGSERHDLAAGLLYELFAPAARARGCRPFTANRLLRTPVGSAYYPDVMVACGPAPHRQHESAPVLLVEVLSPSTVSVDRREKAVAYAACPDLEVLLLVDPDVRRIECARLVEGRLAGWEVHVSGHLVPTRFGDLIVDDLYDQIDAVATT